MKYIIGIRLKELDTVVLDGFNSGEYETNQNITIDDIAQFQPIDLLGDTVTIVEDVKTKPFIEEVINSYNPETNIYEKGLEIKADKIIKSKDLTQLVFTNEFTSIPLKQVLIDRKNKKSLKVVSNG